MSLQQQAYVHHEPVANQHQTLSKSFAGHDDLDLA